MINLLRKKILENKLKGLSNQTIDVIDKHEKIKSIGIISSIAEHNNIVQFCEKLQSSVGKNFNITTFLFCKNKNEAITIDDQNVFGFVKKDINWLGNITNKELKQFIDQPFDLLINFYVNESLELNLVSAKSNANFKVGVAEHHNVNNDLVIAINLDDYLGFEAELTKYLNILNKI